MYKLDVSLERCRDGIRQGANGLFSSALLGKDREVSSEKLIGLRDGNGDSQPVSSRGNGLCSQAIGAEETVDGINGFGFRGNKGLNLLT